MSKSKQQARLKVWWIPQIPGKPFEVSVETPAEARLLLDALAAYDQFQFDNKIKPDYSNAGGLQAFVNGEWEDWYDDAGRDIDDEYYQRKIPCA